GYYEIVTTSSGTSNGRFVALSDQSGSIFTASTIFDPDGGLPRAFLSDSGLGEIYVINPTIPAASTNTVTLRTSTTSGGSITGLVHYEDDENSYGSNKVYAITNYAATTSFDTLSFFNYKQTRTSTAPSTRGNYLFERVAPGNYQIYEDHVSPDLLGYGSTTPDIISMALLQGEHAYQNNFGNWRGGTLSGRVCHDNGIGTGGIAYDGICQPGEPGISGSVIKLYRDNAYLTETQTDVFGNYTFSGLERGTYHVIQENLVDYISTGDADGNVTATGGNGVDRIDFTDETGETQLIITSAYESHEDLFFADVDTSSNTGRWFIAGMVYDDANNNGELDEGESGRNSNGTTDIRIRAVDCTPQNGAIITPNANGIYIFRFLSDTAICNLEITSFAPFSLTQPDDFNSYTNVTVGNSLNPDDDYYNFGLFLSTSISGYTYIERSTTLDATMGNADNEIPVPGVRVSIYRGRIIEGEWAYSLVRNTISDGSGRYEFSDLPIGVYQVTVESKYGFTSITDYDTHTDANCNTDPSAVTHDPNDSCARLTTGPERAELEDINFGFAAEEGTIRGQVFIDANGNGVQDAGETEGIDVVTIRLCAGSMMDCEAPGFIDPSLRAILETQTADNGYFSFDVPTGSYTLYQVRSTLPEGYIATTANSLPVFVDPNGTSSANRFGNWKPIGISGKVFVDQNAAWDEIFEPTPIAGATVSIRVSTQELSLATTTTDQNGDYLFTNLPYETYVITSIDPYGFTGSRDADTNEINPNDPPQNDDPNTIEFTTAAETQIITIDRNTGVDDYKDLHFAKNIPPASISGMVWLDANGNGVLNAGETGLAGATVYLFERLFGRTQIDDTPTLRLAETLESNNSSSFNINSPSSLDEVPDNITSGDSPLGLEIGSELITYNSFISYDATPGIPFGNASGTSAGTNANNGKWQSFRTPSGIGGTINDIRVICSGSVTGVQVDLYSVVDDGFGNHTLGDILTPAIGSITCPAGFDTSTYTNTETVVLEPNQIYAIYLADSTYAWSYTSENNYTHGQSNLGSTIDYHFQITLETYSGTFSGINRGQYNTQILGHPAGSTIRLVDLIPYDQQITDASGQYLFEGIAPGQYFLYRTNPVNYISTTVDTLPAGSGEYFTIATLDSIVSQNFGAWIPGQISGYVFADIDVDGNNEGAIDDGEGLNNVLITLYDSLGNTVATTQTSGNGDYSFNNIPYGTYT
ncbi:MAG TPA: hypothetical protein ENN77_02675, partial [Candidatus Wirthbacteria bacterium]|nr:hypothetical protein [Candidatus Wirthbacteria bacterium]